MFLPRKKENLVSVHTWVRLSLAGKECEVCHKYSDLVLKHFESEGSATSRHWLDLTGRKREKKKYKSVQGGSYANS